MAKILSGLKNIYLVGIGGVGMSGLALLLKERGFNITGSDIQDGVYVSMLRKEGIEVVIGHKKENLSSQVDLVGYSSAIKEDNPEILEARRRKLTILRRGELLSLLCWDKKVIAIGGSHGKTTTSAFLGHTLKVLGYDPAVFIGGVPLNYFRLAWWGQEYFVIETDESDGSFLCYNPWVSVITNIDYEHLDYYKSIGNLNDHFLKFAYQTKEKVIGWGDDPLVRRILSKVGGISFGWAEGNLIRADNFRFDGVYSCFDLFLEGSFFMPVKVPLLGERNVLNSLAVLAFFFHMGDDLSGVIEAFQSFKGTKRRFQVKEKTGGVTFVDDYAHHPTEIMSVLKSASYLNYSRILVVFQPHRFSRVKLLWEEFSRCFSFANELVVTDIYAASEEPKQEIDMNSFISQIKKGFSGKVRYISAANLAQELPQYLEEGDLCLGLGAGDIDILMEGVVDNFKKRSSVPG